MAGLSWDFIDGMVLGALSGGVFMALVLWLSAKIAIRRFRQNFTDNEAESE